MQLRYRQTGCEIVSIDEKASRQLLIFNVRAISRNGR